MADYGSILRRSSYHAALKALVAAAALFIGIPMALVGSATSVQAAPAPPSDLFVTSPPDPIPATPGSVAIAALTVGNIGHDPLEVQITPEEVQLLDNGKTRMVPGTDPQFAGKVSIAPASLNLAARSEQTAKISVGVPAGLGPDDYFLGFLISPIINSSSVAVQNDIGAIVTLDVAGPRDRRLVASYVGVPAVSLSLSGSASGVVRAENVGRSTLQFSTTIETAGWPAPNPSYATDKAHLLPPGLTWDMPVNVTSWLGIGRYTFHTTLVYDITDQTTGEVAISRTVYIINPLWLLILPVIIVSWLWTRRRHREPHRRPQHSAKHNPRRASPPNDQHSGKESVSVG